MAADDLNDDVTTLSVTKFKILIAAMRKQDSNARCRISDDRASWNSVQAPFYPTAGEMGGSQKGPQMWVQNNPGFQKHGVFHGVHQPHPLDSIVDDAVWEPIPRPSRAENSSCAPRTGQTFYPPKRLGLES